MNKMLGAITGETRRIKEQMALGKAVMNSKSEYAGNTRIKLLKNKEWEEATGSFCLGIPEPQSANVKKIIPGHTVKPTFQPIEKESGTEKLLQDLEAASNRGKLYVLFQGRTLNSTITRIPQDDAKKEIVLLKATTPENAPVTAGILGIDIQEPTSLGILKKIP